MVAACQYRVLCFLAGVVAVFPQSRSLSCIIDPWLCSRSESQSFWSINVTDLKLLLELLHGSLGA